MLPFYRSLQAWSDRSKIVDLPLFPGYVFCKFEAERRLPLLTIPGVSHVVGVGKIPIPIDEGEIAALQTAVRSELKLEPWPFVESGERASLDAGPASGLEGFLVRTPDMHRVVLSLSTLKRSVAVEIEGRWLSVPQKRREARVQQC